MCPGTSAPRRGLSCSQCTQDRNGRRDAKGFTLDRNGFHFVPHPTKMTDFFDEAEIRHTKDIVQTRVKIDRFTGGAFESALFAEQPAFGGEFTLGLSLREPTEAERWRVAGQSEGDCRVCGPARSICFSLAPFASLALRGL